MTVTEDNIIRDEQERSNLLRAIADVETAISVSTPGTRRVLENTLENAKKRIVVLDKKIEQAKEEHAAEVQAQAVAIAALAAKENALNAREREEYAGFLKEEFFTKKDFGKLAEFYTHAWDRLSEGGKDEMSHRIWEGVRRNEYQFSELPKIVREKEEDRIYVKLTTTSKRHESLEQIPEDDRNDFIRAYKAGNRDEAGRVLNRESFRRNLFLETSAGEKHQSVTTGKNADDKTALANNKATPQNKMLAAASKMPDINGAEIDLSGMSIADSHSVPSAAAIPDASGSRVNARS